MKNTIHNQDVQTELLKRTRATGKTNKKILTLITKFCQLFLCFKNSGMAHILATIGVTFSFLFDKEIRIQHDTHINFLIWECINLWGFLTCT